MRPISRPCFCGPRSPINGWDRSGPRRRPTIWATWTTNLSPSIGITHPVAELPLQRGTEARGHADRADPGAQPLGRGLHLPALLGAHVLQQPVHDLAAGPLRPAADDPAVRPD